MKKVVLGGLAGGGAGAVFAAVANGGFVIFDKGNAQMIAVVAFTAAVVAFVPSAGIGAICAALSQSRGARSASRIGALIAGAIGVLGGLSLVGMASGNFVIALMLVFACLMGGFAVGIVSTRVAGAKP